MRTSTPSAKRPGGWTWRTSPDVPCRHSWRHVCAGQAPPAGHRENPSNPRKTRKPHQSARSTVLPTRNLPSGRRPPRSQPTENKDTIRFRRRQNAQSGKIALKPCQILPLSAIRKKTLYPQPTTSFVSVTRHSGRRVRNVEPVAHAFLRAVSPLVATCLCRPGATCRVPSENPSRLSARLLAGSVGLRADVALGLLLLLPHLHEAVTPLPLFADVFHERLQLLGVSRVFNVGVRFGPGRLEQLTVADEVRHAKRRQP